MRIAELERADGKVFIVLLGQEGGWRLVRDGRRLRDKGKTGDVCAAEASMSAVVDGRRLGQLEAVLPRGRGCGGRPQDLVAGVVARGGLSAGGLVVPGPLVLAAAADRAGAGSSNVVGEHGGGERRRVEDAGPVEVLGDAGGIRHGFVAGAGPLPLELDVDDGLNGIDAEALPAVLDLDIGQSQPVLQRPGHLQHISLANQPKERTLDHQPWRPGPAAGPCSQPRLVQPWQRRGSGLGDAEREEGVWVGWAGLGWASSAGTGSGSGSCVKRWQALRPRAELSRSPAKEECSGEAA